MSFFSLFRRKKLTSAAPKTVSKPLKGVVVCGVTLPAPEDLGWTEKMDTFTYGTGGKPASSIKLCVLDLGKVRIHRRDWEGKMPAGGYTLNSPIQVDGNPVGDTIRDRAAHNNYIDAVWAAHLTRVVSVSRPPMARLFARCDSNDDYVVILGGLEPVGLPLDDARKLLADLTVAVQLLELDPKERDAARRLGLKPPEVE